MRIQSSTKFVISSDIEMLLLLLSRFSHVQLLATHGLQPIRLLHPWDSPGKSTGLGCQNVKAMFNMVEKNVFQIMSRADATFANRFN